MWEVMLCLDLLQVLIVLDFMEKGDMKSYLDYLTIRSEAWLCTSTVNEYVTHCVNVSPVGVKARLCFQVSSSSLVERLLLGWPTWQRSHSYTET